MSVADYVVMALGASLIVFELWFFLGRRAGRRGARGGLEEGARQGLEEYDDRAGPAGVSR